MDRQYRTERERPSFSSTLLDTIYRSIDDDKEEPVLHRETMRKKQSNYRVKANNAFAEDEEEIANFRRACMIEKWMEKKVSEKVVVVRRKSVADFERKSRKDRESSLLNSSSSSSDSSYEAVYVASSKSSGFTTNRPKPIRTSGSIQKEEFKVFDNYHQEPKKKGGFVKKTGDLKKPKQPISPGGRIVSFINSLFTAGNSKKAKISSSTRDYYGADSNLERKRSNSVHTSTCSSTTSFSRSCLSNTPSSRVKSSNDTKRSVSFHPISVIVDEYSQPCGHKSLHGHESSLEAVKNIRNSINEELRLRYTEKQRRVEEVARDLLRNYQKKVNVDSNNYDDDNEGDDDGASCASSDLFELDNLSAIGMERYSEELPVYETTHFDTNRAIANGLICN